MVDVRTLSDNVTAHMVDDRWSYCDGRVEGDVGEMYVVGYPDAGDRFQGRHGGVTDSLGWGTTYVCTGRSVAQVATLIGLVRTHNDGWTPDPLGNTWSEQAQGARIIPDLDDPSDPRFSFTLRYTLTTRS